MKDSNNLDTVRQFTIKQTIWKRHDAKTANWSFKIRPQFGIPANLFAGFHDCIQKFSTKSICLFIVMRAAKVRSG